jgi:AcrR family transcriptional regulator
MTDFSKGFRDLRFEKLESLKPRERILKTAIALFTEYGVNTVGIDLIISESEVSKRSFYDYYPSKSDLIAAYLEFWEMYRFANLEKHLSKVKGGARAEILAVFDALQDWVCEKDFKGCIFTRGLSDFSSDESVVLRKKVDQHFEKFSGYLKARLIQLVKPAKAKIILAQLMSLIVGAMAVTHATGDVRVPQYNKRIAEDLLGDFSA